jgi:energy-coupling factor transporter transmembrane protein EcfT
MIGTIRWNAILGSIGFLLTFAISIPNNILLTTLLRSCYSALILFVFVFAFRWLLGTVVELKMVDNKLDHQISDSKEELHKGNMLDYTTPDEVGSQSHDAVKNDNVILSEQTFAPLNPPKLISKNNPEPQELVKAIRQLSED